MIWMVKLIVRRLSEGAMDSDWQWDIGRSATLKRTHSHLWLSSRLKMYVQLPLHGQSRCPARINVYHRPRVFFLHGSGIQVHHLSKEWNLLTIAAHATNYAYVLRLQSRVGRTDLSYRIRGLSYLNIENKNIHTNSYSSDIDHIYIHIRKFITNNHRFNRSSRTRLHSTHTFGLPASEFLVDMYTNTVRIHNQNAVLEPHGCSACIELHIPANHI